MCDGSSALNGLFTNGEICDVLEAKNYRHVHYVCAFTSTVIDLICCKKDSLTTDISMLYIDIVNWVMERP